MQQARRGRARSIGNHRQRESSLSSTLLNFINCSLFYSSDRWWHVYNKGGAKQTESQQNKKRRLTSLTDPDEMRESAMHLNAQHLHFCARMRRYENVHDKVLSLKCKSKKKGKGI